MNIAPSRGHILLNLNLPFKLILRRFEVVFWCVEWEWCTFWKIDQWKFIQIHQYYAMALMVIMSWGGGGGGEVLWSMDWIGQSVPVINMRVLKMSKRPPENMVLCVYQQLAIISGWKCSPLPITTTRIHTQLNYKRNYK